MPISFLVLNIRANGDVHDESTRLAHRSGPPTAYGIFRHGIESTQTITDILFEPLLNLGLFSRISIISMAALPPLSMSQTKDDLLKHLNMGPETYALMAVSCASTPINP